MSPEPSERLTTLAKFVVPIAISNTNHRNLYSFAAFASDDIQAADKQDFKPRSFWISNIDYDDEVTISLLNGLNFYITYYDTVSPYVVIHPAETEKVVSKKTRYRKEVFPKIISGRSLDENLLSFWESAQTGSLFMRFLLFFRIIEYAAYHYTEDTARLSIAKIVQSPDLLDNVPQAVDGIVGALSSTQKLHDSQRIRLIVKKCVAPSVLWSDVKDNVDFFSKPTCFDGGFQVDGIVSVKDTEATWGGHRLDNVADAFRKIRNALSHGKDMETTGVIRPTPRNVNLFTPWVHLISAAAGEVVLYKDVS